MCVDAEHGRDSGLKGGWLLKLLPQHSEREDLCGSRRVGSLGMKTRSRTIIKMAAHIEVFHISLSYSVRRCGDLFSHRDKPHRSSARVEEGAESNLLTVKRVD